MMYVYETTYILLLLDLTVTTIMNSMVTVLETVNLFPIGKVHPSTGTEALYRLYGP
jgi:hypothetical protein